MLPLHLLTEGSNGIIEDVCAPDGHVDRLRELGIDIGLSVTMIRSGTPCIIRVGEKEFAFRNDESTLVLVTPSI